MTGRALSGPAAAVIIARLTLRRLVRGRVLWLSAGLVALPGLAIVLFPENPSQSFWREVYTLLLGLLAVIAPLFLAAAVSEESEDSTITYLWSRPFPRWSLLAGKLVALVPLAAALLCAGVALAFAIGFGASPGELGHLLPHGLLAMALGTVTAGAFCVAVGALVTRHATAVALIYLLFLDTTVALMPFALRNLTIRYHIDQLAMTGPNAGDLAWLAGMTALWLGLAVWRIGSAEYAVGAR